MIDLRLSQWVTEDTDFTNGPIFGSPQFFFFAGWLGIFHPFIAKKKKNQGLNMIKLPIQGWGWLGMFMFQTQSDRLLFARQEAATQLLLCYLLSIIGDKARTRLLAN